MDNFTYDAFTALDTVYFIWLLSYINSSSVKAYVMSHISDSIDSIRGIERFENRFDFKKWFTGFMVLHNETKTILKVIVATTANYKIISDTEINANAQVNASGLSIGGGMHQIYEDAKNKESSQIYYIQRGEKQPILLYEKQACMTILAVAPDSSSLIVISKSALVIKGRRYFIKQTDFDVGLELHSKGLK